MPTRAGGGNLAFGPDGNLYYCSGTFDGTGQLWSVNPLTGSVTPIGTGQGTPVGGLLALVSAGGQLYGINENGLSGLDGYPISIYTINTITGVATATGVDVTGLPLGFNLTGAASVPEPSTLSLVLTGSLAFVCLKVVFVFHATKPESARGKRDKAG